MKHYTELNTGRGDSTDRGDPCIEYPGEWFVNFPNKQDTRTSETTEAFPTLESAIRKAQKILDAYEDQKIEYNPRDFTISWKCSDDDPRIGLVWFTGHYRHGHFNHFGNYVSSSASLREALSFALT